MMTSSTSTTSTMGVTLIPTMPPRVRLLEVVAAISLSAFGCELIDPRRRRRLLMRHVREHAVVGSRDRAAVLLDLHPCGDELGQRLHVALDLADLLLHDVEGDDRGYGDEDADAG